jgi:hypothetical protein
MFFGIEFYLFPRGKHPIFRFRLNSSLVLEFTFQTYQLVYYNLFVFVSSIAKISSSFLSLVLLNNIRLQNIVTPMSHWTNVFAGYLVRHFRQMATSEHVHRIDGVTIFIKWASFPSTVHTGPFQFISVA